MRCIENEIGDDDLFITNALDLLILHGWPTADTKDWVPEEGEQGSITQEMWNDDQMLTELNGIPFGIIPPARFTLRVDGRDIDCYWNGTLLIDVERRCALYDSTEGETMN